MCAHSVFIQCVLTHWYSMCVHSVCVHSLIVCACSLIQCVCVHSVCALTHTVSVHSVRSLSVCACTHTVWECVSVCVCVCACMHAPSVYIKHLIYPDMTRDSQAAGCREKKHLLWQPKGQWTQATITPREVKQKGWLRDSCQGHDSKGRTLKHFADTTTSSQLFIIDLIRLHESKTLKQIFNFHCMFSCCCSLNGNH